MTLTPDQLAKSREEFEVIIRKQDSFDERFLAVGDDGQYKSDIAKSMLVGWIIRQESLVVELPECLSLYQYHDEDCIPSYDAQELKDSLQSAGINYREKE